MQRINFENTTVTKQPYVVIDSTEYAVQEGTYTGGTDLDADTFNTLQDNIEDALSNVGGNEIAISETEPTTETTKLWINSGEVGSQASEITNSYSTSTGIGYSANYMNTYIDDTGWVDMSSYVNTSNFTVRSGQPPMARRIGKVVYWKGSVYCSTAVNNREATILSGIPSQFRPTGEFGRCGVTWYISTPYHIFVDDTGAVKVSESSNIEVQNDWAGFTLANINGYLVD